MFRVKNSVEEEVCHNPYLEEDRSDRTSVAPCQVWYKSYLTWQAASAKIV
jgi:hypothetical protein